MAETTEESSAGPWTVFWYRANDGKQPEFALSHNCTARRQPLGILRILLNFLLLHTAETTSNANDVRIYLLAVLDVLQLISV